jgi:hypothetical protein
MKPGDALTTNRTIRSQKTGLILPREGMFLGAIENLGRTLLLVNFGSAGEEYVFPSEVSTESCDRNVERLQTLYDNRAVDCLL